jgi:acyl-CoA reductase-like NAD-dependent aldehyde dehydrogenase
MFNSGQACICVERVYVEAPVYDEFVAKLTDKVGQLRQGQDDREYRFDVAAIATAAQRDIVQRHVDEAVAAGARATTGGRPIGVGTFFQPTVHAGSIENYVARRTPGLNPGGKRVKFVFGAATARCAGVSPG